jgi:hypothetical protein
MQNRKQSLPGLVFGLVFGRREQPQGDNFPIKSLLFTRFEDILCMCVCICLCNSISLWDMEEKEEKTCWKRRKNEERRQKQLEKRSSAKLSQ